MNKPTKLFIIFALVYVLIQFIYVTFYHLPFVSDSLMFYNFAQQSLAIDKLYPNIAMINADYIVSPVYVNYIFLILKVFHSPFAILYFNIILNIIQLYLIYKITCLIFDEQTAIIAGIIYMLYLTNLAVVLSNLTELLSGVLILTCLYLYISNGTFVKYFICGFFAGLSFGARPIAIVILFSYILICLFQFFIKKKKNFYNITFILIGFFTFIVLMGTISKKNIGHFIYTAGTGQINLALSSNDTASGVYDKSIFKNDSILKSKSTYIEKKDYLFHKSIKWFKKHPFKFFTTIPRKIYSTFISDDWVVSQLAHTHEWDLNKFIKSFKSPVLKIKFNNESFGFRIYFIALNLYHQLFYMCLLFLLLFQFTHVIKNRTFDVNIIILNLSIILCYGLTVIATVGTPRYKYPMFLLGIILIAPIVKNLLINKYHT